MPQGPAAAFEGGPAGYEFYWVTQTLCVAPTPKEKFVYVVGRALPCLAHLVAILH